MADELDAGEVGLFAFRVWGYKQGELVSLMVHLGDRLGLFAAMAGAGTLTSDQLAERTGYDERWVREWLAGMAAADLIDSDDGAHFTMSPVAAAVLTDEDHLAFASGAFFGGFGPDYVDLLADAFRTGIGPDYDSRGPQGAHVTERMLGPWARQALVPTILPRLGGMIERLSGGARVLDIGCGAGVAMEAIARAFPNSEVVGVDLSVHAVERARERLAGLDNVSIRHGRAEDVTDAEAYDLVLTFDCLHDMTRPGDAIGAVRRAIHPDGTWLAKEIRCWPTWEQNRANPMLAMFYGFSLTGCMASATSEPDGAGLGTVGLHGDLLEEMAIAAGFSRFVTHDVEDPANLYYEIRV
ncbi:MAG TPA: class I SAM-dependent methyltransferase [Acidimicrobiales bacterium]